MYEHEYYESKNKYREIQHICMPTMYDDLDTMMCTYLAERGLSYSLARANGWYPAACNDVPRIIIPCVNSAGFNYWQARAMDDHPIRYMSPTIPRKDSIVFLWPKESLSSAKNIVVITEGPMDALAAAEFFPAIAIMGAVPSDAVLTHIARKVHQFGFKNWIIVPDKDNLALYDKFRAYGHAKMLLPTCKDLAATPRWERDLLLKNV
jgi:hypothetical protein